ncbi:transcription factor bHLH162-like isoform X2 [Amaranthus tricolor]|uniref:transcription factor bHLH162-like isoform X2 n=1 Tax=Amaranthus tricolor TaxID=29722 RepID=UPI00258486C1|nr:transcription factor bHLH162-like isoform X2 [Amaranthus tricolor]
MNKKSSSSKRNRAAMEKDRRNQMRDLYSQLNSLVPQDASFQRAIPDQIDDAANYIRQLQGNVDNLRQTRDGLLGGGASQGGESGSGSGRNLSVQIEVNENGSALVVNLITAVEYQFVFTEVVRILNEENAEVVDASYSAAENTVFHTVHAQMGEAASIERITEKLKRFEL